MCSYIGIPNVLGGAEQLGCAAGLARWTVELAHATWTLGSSALIPAVTPRFRTAAGTVEFDPELGVPVILYTGVYLKTNTDSVAAHGLPPPEHDPGTRFVEKQLAAVPADPGEQSVLVPRPAFSRCHACLFAALHSYGSSHMCLICWQGTWPHRRTHAHKRAYPTLTCTSTTFPACVVPCALPSDDPDLTFWVKLPTPVMSLPPAGLNISCWRDPFCLQRPAAAGERTAAGSGPSISAAV
jgi:hypothetical protein